MAVGQNQQSILVGIGMFTGGTGFLLMATLALERTGVACECLVRRIRLCMADASILGTCLVPRPMSTFTGSKTRVQRKVEEGQ